MTTSAVALVTAPNDSLDNHDLDSLALLIRDEHTAHYNNKVDHALQQGRYLARARELCDNPHCGVEGDNPNARFGAYVASQLTGTDIVDEEGRVTRTARNYRVLYETFGHLDAAVVGRIGLANCYTLYKQPHAIQQQVIDLAKRRRKKRVSHKELLEMMGEAPQAASDAPQATPDAPQATPAHQPEAQAPAAPANPLDAVEDAVIVEASEAPETVEAPEPLPVFMETLSAAQNAAALAVLDDGMSMAEAQKVHDVTRPKLRDALFFVSGYRMAMQAR